MVIGATGAIGSAFVEHLRADARCGEVLTLSRSTTPAIDFQNEDSIAQAADHVRAQGPLHLVLVATGVLHGGDAWPEKRLGELSYARLLANFTINTLGPAMVLARFAPLLARDERALFGVLSAKVGSIGDNRLGGWYSYRASKAALNMIVKTASIELARTHRRAVIAALHPGTVASPLSAPFNAMHAPRPPAIAAAEMLDVLDGIDAADSGGFWAYDGQRLPW